MPCQAVQALSCVTTAPIVSSQLHSNPCPMPGGAGGVTFELRHTHGIRCTLVDPRPLKLNKAQLRQLQAARRAAHVTMLSAAQLQQEAEGGPADAAAQDLAAPDLNTALAGSEAAEAAVAEPLDFLQVG